MSPVRWSWYTSPRKAGRLPLAALCQAAGKVTNLSVRVELKLNGAGRVVAVEKIAGNDVGVFYGRPSKCVNLIETAGKEREQQAQKNRRKTNACSIPQGYPGWLRLHAL